MLSTFNVLSFFVWSILMSDVDAIGTSFSIGEPKKISGIRDGQVLRGDAADSKMGALSAKLGESQGFLIEEVRESAKVAEEIVNANYLKIWPLRSKIAVAVLWFP
jgi:hypothetical protein